MKRLKGKLLIMISGDRVLLEIDNHEISLSTESALLVSDQLARGVAILRGEDKPKAGDLPA